MNETRYKNMEQALATILEWTKTSVPCSPSRAELKQICREALQPTSDTYDTYGKHGEIVTEKKNKSERRNDNHR